ncbi:MAG: protoporphyrinogen oxidase HemJ [Alphaproteobacteria bacterium]|nr:MAG: protoporphyrinogen oxidase HemJ [Alphaproteobacteria bacterium]
MFYLYIKSFHLILLIAWMVSLLYLPRLFVYHCGVSINSSSYNLLLLMEKRLIKIIAIPAMTLTFLFGIILLSIQNELLYENYFIIKLLSVTILLIYQIYLIRVYLAFKRKKNKRSARFYKLINEIPTIFMIIIILLVVLKPNLG